MPNHASEAEEATGAARGLQVQKGEPRRSVGREGREMSRPALPIPQLTLTPKVRTITHLPSRFLRRSIKTNSPLMSFPS